MCFVVAHLHEACLPQSLPFLIASQIMQPAISCLFIMAWHLFSLRIKEGNIVHLPFYQIWDGFVFWHTSLIYGNIWYLILPDPGQHLNLWLTLHDRAKLWLLLTPMSPSLPHLPTGASVFQVFAALLVSSLRIYCCLFFFFLFFLAHKSHFFLMALMFYLLY